MIYFEFILLSTVKLFLDPFTLHSINEFTVLVFMYIFNSCNFQNQLLKSTSYRKDYVELYVPRIGVRHRIASKIDDPETDRPRRTALEDYSSFL